MGRIVVSLQKKINHELCLLITSRESSNDDLMSQIKGNNILSASRALEVYREDYRARLTEALRNTYRGIYTLIGNEDFQKIALDYIDSTPSLSPDLDDYGAQFDQFCFNHDLSKEYDFLKEMAYFEWQFRILFHKKSNIGFNHDELHRILMNDDRVSLVESTTLLSFSFLISQLYGLIDVESPEPFDYHQPQWLVLYKDHDFVRSQSLLKLNGIFFNP